MIIRNFYSGIFALLLTSINYSDAQTPDPNIAIVKEIGQEIENLKKNKDNLTLEETTDQAENILTNLENKVADQDKLVVSIGKQESSKMFAKNIEYNKFLDKIADPAFFNYEVLQDPKKLDLQIITAKEYVAKSKDMAQIYKQLPQNIKNAMIKNKIDQSKITPFLNGLKQSEADAKKPASKIFAARIMHAEALLKGLEYLKAWKGKWQYDKPKDLIVFNSQTELTVWDKDVIEPLNKAGNFLNS